MRGPAYIAREPSRPRGGLRFAVAAALIVSALLPAVTRADKKKKVVAVPLLTAEHRHPAGGLVFRTPESWKVEAPPETPEVVNATGDGVAVRFLYREGDSGFDSLHGLCMLERLAPAMDMFPVVEYQYDFVGGVIGGRRALDSAFIVSYDQPILGEKQWRQRNVTIVGEGSSLCAITYAPLPLWKKSAPTRALLDAVLGSVTFR
jgi:hypothetical protein